MEASQIYITIAILSFLAIALIFFLVKGRKHKKASPLTYLAFLFVILGIIFGDNRYIGYGLMGVGIVIAVIDIILKEKKPKQKH